MIKSLDITTKRYVKKSMIAFIEGGKYPKDRKPLSLNWIKGVITNSGIKREILEEVFSELNIYLQNGEEKSRLDLLLKECHGQNFL